MPLHTDITLETYQKSAKTVGGRGTPDADVGQNRLQCHTATETVGTDRGAARVKPVGA